MSKLPSQQFSISFPMPSEEMRRDDIYGMFKESKVNKLPRPLGARVLVEEIVTSLSIRERGKRAGLTIITNEDDKLANWCTLGKILLVGSDPFLAENGIEVGKIVYFARTSGKETYVEGKRYRTLEFPELTNVLDEMPSDGRMLNSLDEVEL